MKNLDNNHNSYDSAINIINHYEEDFFGFGVLH